MNYEENEAFTPKDVDFRNTLGLRCQVRTCILVALPRPRNTYVVNY
ncbi:MAG: hypothetical protein AAF757_20345 [Cyanobacteria bacterium P01_D01_bin.116]